MYTLDLHGYTYEEAGREVERFINTNWGSGDARIVTGHSRLMRGVVVSVLKKYKVTYTIGDVLQTTKAYIVVNLD